MADVQVEDGFTRIANTLLDALIRVRMPGRHKDVALAIVRLTYGYNRKADHIGSTQVAQLVDVRDERSVRRILADLAAWGVCRSEQRGVGQRRLWRLEKDFERWSIGETGEATRRGRRAARVGDTPGSRVPRVGRDPGSEHPGEDTPRPPGGTHPGTPGGTHPDSKDRRKTVSKDREEEASLGGGAIPEKEASSTPGATPHTSKPPDFGISDLPRFRPEFYEQLARENPLGLPIKPIEVAAWVALKWPKIRGRYRAIKRTLINWWSELTLPELDQARTYLANRHTEALKRKLDEAEDPVAVHGVPRLHQGTI